METYLMMLYVTLDQESALKNFFSDQGWTFSKPDLSVTTDKLGPSIGNAPANFNKDDTDLECPPAVPGKRKANATQRKAPKIKLAKILPTSTDVKSSTESVSRKTQEKEDAIDEEAGIFDEMTMAQYDVKEVGNMIFKMKKRKENSSEEIAEGNHDAADNNIDDVGDEENDDTDSIEGINDEDNEEKPDGSSVSNKSIKKEIQEMNKTNTKKEYHQKFADGQYSDISTQPVGQMEEIKRLLSESEHPDFGYECCVCSRKIKVKYNMKRHLRTHLPDQINCIICNRFFESFEEKGEHMRTRHSYRHTCESCGVSFKRKSDLNAHMIKHESVSDQETSYGCFRCTYKDCGKLFLRRTNYEYHLNVHRGIRPYECVHCLRSFHSKYTKNEHERDCLNDSWYKCDQCERVFKQRSGLHNHKQAEHVRKEKGYPCNICSQLFKFSSGLIRHKKEKHQPSFANQTTEADITSGVKVASEGMSGADRDIVIPTSSKEVIFETENEAPNTSEDAQGGEEIEEENIEVIPVTSDALKIVTTMGEQVHEQGGEINVGRVIVIHQVASDMPQHLEDMHK